MNRQQWRQVEKDAAKATPPKKLQRPSDAPRDVDVAGILGRRNARIDQLEVEVEALALRLAEYIEYVDALEAKLAELRGDSADDATQDGEPRDNVTELPNAASAAGD